MLQSSFLKIPICTYFVINMCALFSQKKSFFLRKYDFSWKLEGGTGLQGVSSNLNVTITKKRPFVQTFVSHQNDPNWTNGLDETTVSPVEQSLAWPGLLIMLVDFLWTRLSSLINKWFYVRREISYVRCQISYKGFPVVITLAWKMCEKLLHHHFTLTTYQLMCQNLCIVHMIQNLQKYVYIFGGLGSHRPVCLKKVQQFEIFSLSPFWNLNFGISSQLLVFLVNDMKNVPFLSLNHQFVLHLWASFYAKFEHKDYSFIWVSKGEKWIIPLHPFLQLIKTKYFNLNCTHI